MSAAEQTPTMNDFAQQLGTLASECSGLEWVVGRYDMSFSKEESDSARKSFKRAAAQCQAFLLHAPQLFSSYLEMDVWARSNGHSDDLDSFIIPFAIGLESDDLTVLSKWIGEGLMTIDAVDSYPGTGVHPSTALARSRRISMHAPYSDDRPGAEEKMIRPAFFHKGEFRHGFLHQQVFRREVDECMKTICESSRHSAVESAKWVNLIHKASVENAVTGKVLNKELGEYLRRARIDGLETLRDYIVGSHTPSGQECSERATRLFSDLVYRELMPVDINNHLATLRLNERYFSTLFFDELVRFVADRCRHFNDNERGDEYDEGKQGARQFTELFRQLELSQSQLATMAMTVTAKFSRGQQMDLSELPCVDQMDKIMISIQEDSYVTLNPEGNLRHTVLLAVISSLPKKMVIDIAQKRDASRMMMYKLTGKDMHLKGMVDKKLIDSAFGADLGL